MIPVLSPGEYADVVPAAHVSHMRPGVVLVPSATAPPAPHTSAFYSTTAHRQIEERFTWDDWHCLVGVLYQVTH